MGWRKKKQVSEYDEVRRMVRSTRIPILVLDNKWHELFPDYKKTSKIKELERQLNELLKKQGKITDESKEMKKLKQKLMEEIISNISEEGGEVGRFKQKKQEKSQKMILDINNKLEKYEKELDEIPNKIKRVNEDLLIESIHIWHTEMEHNRGEIEALNQWILDAREKLKSNILRKQDMETQNSVMYSYMHNLLGAQLMEQVDLTNKK